MNYNNSTNRQRFKNKQRKQAKTYKRHGMSEEAIQIMYKDDLIVHNSNRRKIEHEATPEEMTTYDPSTGESHYKDMDEFPAQPEAVHYSLIGSKWLEDIEDKNLYMALKAMSDDYITIISMKMDGYTDEEIGNTFNVKRKTINNKILRIKKILKNFI